MTKKIGEGIPILSIGVKRFVERMVKDDDFFMYAIENPAAALKEMGVNIDASKLEPESLGAFFGALANVRDSLKKKNIKAFTFEKIFGQPAIIPGNVAGEIDIGICKDFVKNAFLKRHVVIVRSRFMPMEIDVPREIYSEIYVGGYTPGKEGQKARVSESQNLEVGYNKSWDGKDAATHQGSYRVVNVNFGGLQIQDILVGPLISPEDLNVLTKRINAAMATRA